MKVDFPEVNQDNPGDHVWQDVTRHCTSWQTYVERNDLVTTAHEATHGANATIRNQQQAADPVNGFYLLNGTALVVKEPKFRKSLVVQYVPQALRGLRFNTYVQGMRDWDDRPLYLWDEYTAYTNGALCAAQLKDRNEYTMSWSDWAMGPLEFNVYALAVMAAAQQQDKDTYTAIGPDFGILWARGWNAYFAAEKYFPWAADEIRAQHTPQMFQHLVIVRDKQEQLEQAIRGMTDEHLLGVLSDLKLTIPTAAVPDNPATNWLLI